MVNDDSIVFEYFINLDERGEFRADVRDANGSTVFDIDGFDMFENGFMSHAKDLYGLECYLKSLGLIPENGVLETVYF